MAATPTTRKTGHVVMIPSPFLGHMIPMLDFAKCLSKYYHVTYIVPRSQIQVLQDSRLLSVDERNEIVSNHPYIDFICIFDDNEHRYEISDTNVNIDIEPVIERMRQPLQQVLFSESAAPVLASRSVDRPIDLIVSDMFVCVHIRQALEKGIITHVFFSTHLATISLLISCAKGENPALKPSVAVNLLESYSLTHGIICNSMDPLEKRAVDDFHQQPIPCAKIPVRCVAPLTSEEFDANQNADIIAQVDDWLDAQAKFGNGSATVIYVAFGSLTCFAPEQLVQISEALASYPTIWSLKISAQSCLPSSFVEDSKHLQLSWAPQRRILSHSAVRLFISHGGWNSTLESLQAGKPMLVWPLFADQMSNGQRVEKEFQTGLCIKDTNFAENHRVVASDELAQYLKAFLDQEAQLVANAQRMQQACATAKETASRVSLEEIIHTVDEHVAARTLKEKH